MPNYYELWLGHRPGGKGAVRGIHCGVDFGLAAERDFADHFAGRWIVNRNKLRDGGRGFPACADEVGDACFHEVK